MEKNSPEDKELINALKDEISKKETKKIAEEKKFYSTRKNKTARRGN